MKLISELEAYIKTVDTASAEAVADKESKQFIGSFQAYATRFKAVNHIVQDSMSSCTNITLHSTCLVISVCRLCPHHIDRRRSMLEQ